MDVLELGNAESFKLVAILLLLCWQWSSSIIGKQSETLHRWDVSVASFAPAAIVGNMEKQQLKFIENSVPEKKFPDKRTM